MPVLTMDQALTVDYFHDANHKVWRRNGQTKVWKRTPGKFRIPVKFGLYRYDYIDEHTDTVHIPSDDCPTKRR